jgi:hypothetical protein
MAEHFLVKAIPYRQHYWVKLSPLLSWSRFLSFSSDSDESGSLPRICFLSFMLLWSRLRRISQASALILHGVLVRQSYQDNGADGGSIGSGRWQELFWQAWHAAFLQSGSQLPNYIILIVKVRVMHCCEGHANRSI